VDAALARLQAQRHARSLHLDDDPPGTFPYYHPDDATVLPQSLRLPSHTGWDGTGVTVAFLDSGYYPHPDLTVDPVWPAMPEWNRLDVAQLRAALCARPLRIAQYVDLTDAGEAVGLDLPSLWDGAGDSWHGQMTSVMALGNGLLSGGAYRGYAPGASGLLIKIGRGGGRIPEADILRGLNWLLEGDRWAALGVRVLNVSVGGDFDEPWHLNPVCLAAEELSRRGVLIAAAAGNRGLEQLLAPAQAPTVLTVGGVDDHNRRWSPLHPHEIARLELYPHNWGRVGNGHALIRKPEILALGRWLPSPILPPSPILDEMVAIGRLRTRLAEGGDAAETLAAHWRTALHEDPHYLARHPQQHPDDWRREMAQALRKRMNAHKWVHPFYQQVDGTSVAVAQVSAVAAQMFAANPALSARQARRLLLQSAQPLAHLPHTLTGAGLLQPTRAVAAALRVAGGALTGLPHSGSQPDHLPDAPRLDGAGPQAAAGQVYVGLWQPTAHAVSVVGDFNGWTPHRHPLVQTRDDWWHGSLSLPAGSWHYRFWVEEAAGATWLPDPENPARAESGYTEDHSVVQIL
jgi:serine protease AprX